jgi:hypothetical protein
VSDWFRRRWWVVAGTVAAVVAVVVTVIAVSGDDAAALGVMPLERVLDADAGGVMPALAGVGSILFDAEVDPHATDLAYFSYIIGDLPEVTAHRAGSDRPLWTFRGDGTVTAVHLSTVGDVLLVFSTCKALCPQVIGLDPGSGKRLWTADVPAASLIGDAGGYAVLQLADGETLTDVAGIDVRTGEVAWRTAPTEGRDRYAMVPGTTRMAHYAPAGTLSLVDITTGQTPVTVTAPPYADGDSPELTASAGEVALKTGAGSTVYAATDLAQRWTRDAIVHAIEPDLLYVSGSDHGTVVDGSGRVRWRTENEVFFGADGDDWGLSWRYESAGGSEVTYVDLATGRRLTGDDHAPAYREKGGVLQVDGIDNEGDATFWYLALPSGRHAELGTHDILAGTCAFGHTLIACLDTRGRLGMWRYR